MRLQVPQLVPPVRRVDEAGADGVHAHAAVLELDTHGTREHVARAFARIVRDLRRRRVPATVCAR